MANAISNGTEKNPGVVLDEVVTESRLYRFSGKVLVVALTLAAGWGAFVFGISRAKSMEVDGKASALSAKLEDHQKADAAAFVAVDQRVEHRLENVERQVSQQTDYIFALSKQMATNRQPEILKVLPDGGTP